MNKYDISLNVLKEAFTYLNFPQIIDTTWFKNLEDIVKCFEILSKCYERNNITLVSTSYIPTEEEMKFIEEVFYDAKS